MPPLSATLTTTLSTTLSTTLTTATKKAVDFSVCQTLGSTWIKTIFAAFKVS